MMERKEFTNLHRGTLKVPEQRSKCFRKTDLAIECELKWRRQNWRVWLEGNYIV